MTASWRVVARQIRTESCSFDATTSTSTAGALLKDVATADITVKLKAP